MSMTECTTSMENTVCKISLKSVENWLSNPQNLLTLVDEFNVNLTNSNTLLLAGVLTKGGDRWMYVLIVSQILIQIRVDYKF